MAKIYHVDLSVAEQAQLQKIVNKRKSTSQASKRSKILLSADGNGQFTTADARIKLKKLYPTLLT